MKCSKILILLSVLVSEVSMQQAGNGTYFSFFGLADPGDVTHDPNTTNSPSPKPVASKPAVIDTGQTKAAGLDKVPSDKDKTNPVGTTEAKRISVFCNPSKLEKLSKSNGKGENSPPIAGKQENTFYDSVFDEWRKLTPDENATVSSALMNNNITSIPNATSFAKIPTECILQHKLTGITFEQAEALILKERVDIAWHTMAFLDEKLKVQLFSSLLHENKLPEFMKEVLGRSFGGTIVGRKIHGSDHLDCHWLGGAITDSNLSVTTFINIVAALAAAKCDFKHLRDLSGLCKKAEELLRQDTLHQVIAATKHLLPYCEIKECKAIFTNVRLMELISDPRNVAKFDFDDIPWLQPTPPCEDINRQPSFIPAGSPCAVYLAKLLSKEWSEMTAATWRSLGGLQPYYDMSALQKQIRAVADSPCPYFNFYDLYKWRGAYLGVKCQWTVSRCSTQDPLRNLSNTIANATVSAMKDIAGYLPFIHQNVIKSCPNDSLCNPQVKAGYINVLPYGKYQPISQKCSIDLFELSKAVPLCKGGAERLTTAVPISKLFNETKKLKACLADDKCRTMLGSFPRTVAYLLMSKMNLTQTIGTILRDPALAASFQAADLCDNNQTIEKDSKLSKGQCSCARDKLLKEKHLSKWTVSDLRKYKYIMPCLTPQMIREIPIDADTLAAILCSPAAARYLPQETKKAIADKLILKLDTSMWPHAKGITTDRMLVMGTCLTQLPSSYIKKVPSNICKEFCRQFRNQLDPRHAVCEPITNFHQVVDVCKKCIQTNTNSPLTSPDIMALGLLSCGLTSKDLSVMSGKVFLEAMEVFAGCAVMKTTTEAVFLNKIVQPDNFRHFSKWNSSTITRLGRTITYLNRTSFAAIPKHARDQTISQVNTKIWSGLSCIGRMFGATTASFIKERNQAVDLAFRKPQELRFRRFNDPKSRLCNNGMDTVPHLEKVSYDITPNELNGIPKENFASCLSTLGAYQAWSEVQKNTLLIRVNADINEVCKLSPSEVMSSQHILTAVTKSHLRCIDLADIDILTTLGNPTMNWTSEKLTHLAERYKILNPYFKLSNSSAEDLVSLGIILCGFKEDGIKLIDPTIYRKVSVVLGTYTACPINKVTALLDVASRKTAYGPVAKWTCSTIADVGILMAAIPGESLALLGDKLNCIPEEIFAIIPPSAIKAIPESVMALLTPAVFNTLTPEQLRVAHLTEDQIQMTMSVAYRPMTEARKASSAAGYLDVCLKTIILVTVALFLTFLSPE